MTAAVSGRAVGVCADGGVAQGLRRAAIRDPHAVALIYLGDGETETDRISFGELDRRARALAANLIDRGLAGQRVLILQLSGVSFAVALWACLYAGVTAVPAPGRARGEGLARLLAVARDAEVAAGLGSTADAEQVEDLGRLPWIWADSTEEASSRPMLEEPSRPDSRDTALIQYTSGSSGSPKGVVISHGALAANLEMVRAGMAVHEHSVVFSWLPLYHDMGLIGAFLMAAHAGRPCVLAPPLSFVQKPERWLRAISRHRATYSGAPSFAYEICARRADRMDLTGVDLSCWDSAFCGAEPVRESALARFAQAFAPYGFRPDALRPCYGLAEATLIVSGGPSGGVRTLPGRGADAPAVVGCGAPAPGATIAVVDPHTGASLPDGEEGEIWVAGPHLADGYWARPDETADTFKARLAGSALDYLRTGDLGKISAGELFVTGRRKDVLIHRGENLNPADVEQAIADSHPGFGATGAAFQLEDGEIVAAQEVARGVDEDASEAMAQAALRAVAHRFGVRLHEVLLVRPRAIPLTTSGKVRRAACRELYLGGRLKLAKSAR